MRRPGAAALALALAAGGALAAPPGLTVPERARVFPLTCQAQEALGAALEKDALLHRPLAELASGGPRKPAGPPGYWGTPTAVGCALVVASPDDRVRVWRLSLESADEQATRKAGRGLAFLQWVDGKGAWHALRDGGAPDLHLDALIDQVAPLGEGRWLFAGLRAYATTFPRAPRRFAFAVRLGEDGAATLLPLFAGEPGLYLAAATPETGKFRHHPLAGRRLAYDPKARALTLEDVPGQKVGPPRAPELVARWDGRAFALQGRAWGAIERAQGF